MTTFDKVAAKAELERLTQAHGGMLTPEDVVNAAKPKSSLLHNWFQWDDTVAAHLYRLDQARQLIKVVHISITYAPSATVVVPAYVSERDAAGDQHYVSVIEVMSDAQRTTELVKTTLHRAMSILRNCPEPTCQRLADRLEQELANL